MYYQAARKLGLETKEPDRNLFFQALPWIDLVVQAGEPDDDVVGRSARGQGRYRHADEWAFGFGDAASIDQEGLEQG